MAQTGKLLIMRARLTAVLHLDAIYKSAPMGFKSRPIDLFEMKVCHEI
jgi:hypothetical protein